MNVSDKIAIVTGGGQGIGRGIAMVLARNGASVVVADIDGDSGQSAAAEIASLGRGSMAQVVDVTVQESIDGMVEAVLSRFRQIDILVNNAGVGGAPGWGGRVKPSEEDWELVQAVNVKGVVRATEAVVPHMKRRRYGKIVNIASGAGRQGSPQTSPAYSASKAGLINMTQSWALELAEFNINVNAICPGPIWTALWEDYARRMSAATGLYQGQNPREMFDSDIKNALPLRREQTAEDIGNAVAFLASDYAKNITGQALNVSGGGQMN